MIRTAESVSSGHPDKICDYISDSILDAYLGQDENSRVACECFITKNMLVIGGEAHSKANIDVIGIAKDKIREIGYNADNGFDVDSATYINTMHEQSPNIRECVEHTNGSFGAGDQGVVYGFACSETMRFMPLESVLANETMKTYDRLRFCGELPFACPDAKCQFTIDTENPCNKTIVFSFQHKPELTQKETMKEYVLNVLDFAKGLNPELEPYFTVDDKTTLLVNPSGCFIIGGPEGDTGLTGRKIIVDTYGGRIPHGGGAFSGKDYTKTDRSAAYYARFLAKNLVAAHIGDNITVRLSYAIGVEEPVDIDISGNLFFPKQKIIDFIRLGNWNPTPINILNVLSLKNVSYCLTSNYGHFGDILFPWEKLDMVPFLAETFFDFLCPPF